MKVKGDITRMNWETVIDQILKLAGVIDAMFFFFYAIDNIINWFRNRKG